MRFITCNPYRTEKWSANVIVEKSKQLVKLCLYNIFHCPSIHFVVVHGKYEMRQFTDENTDKHTSESLRRIFHAGDVFVCVFLLVSVPYVSIYVILCAKKKNELQTPKQTAR